MLIYFVCVCLYIWPLHRVLLLSSILVLYPLAFLLSLSLLKRRISNKLILTMLGKTLTAVALLAGNAAAKIFYAGVAESGGEFGVYSKPSPLSHSSPQLQTPS